MSSVQLDEAVAASVFTEWKSRYDADPEVFQSCEAFKGQPPLDYGDGAARYFLWLLKDMEGDLT